MSLEPRIAPLSFECLSKLAVPHQQEVRLGEVLHQPGRNFDEPLGSLLWLETRDLDDEGSIGWDTQLGTHRTPTGMGAKRREVDP